jgi:hypothetical protein
MKLTERVMKIFGNLTSERWYRGELIRALRRGPGAVSLYFSLLIGVLCSFLSFTIMREMETASMVVSLAMVLLSLNFIIYDLWSYVRNHGLFLVRLVARRSENRIKRLKVESSSIFGLLDWLYADSDFEKLFRSQSRTSIQTVVKALDRLSGTAIRYGSRGKYVFEQNLEPFLAADVLLRSDRKEFTLKPLAPELTKLLEEVPYYDPEGWALIFNGDCCTERIPSG